MTGQLHWHVAQAKLETQLSVAAQRRRAESGGPQVERPSDDRRSIHGRQRVLVTASLLMLRREDSASDRRHAHDR
jgi:hypothetical protein